MSLYRLGYTSVSESVSTAVFSIEAVLFLLGTILGLLGLVGLYISQSEASGSFGLVGLLGSFIGLVLIAGVAWNDVFVLPSLAKVAPVLLDETFIGFGGFILSFVLAGLGGILYGLATLKSRVYPRPAALLYTIGVALTIVGTLLGLPLLSIIFDVAVAWLGLELCTGRIGQQVQQSTRVR